MMSNQLSTTITVSKNKRPPLKEVALNWAPYKGAIFFINPPTIPFVGQAIDLLYPAALHNA